MATKSVNEERTELEARWERIQNRKRKVEEREDAFILRPETKKHAASTSYKLLLELLEFVTTGKELVVSDKEFLKNFAAENRLRVHAQAEKNLDEDCPEDKVFVTMEWEDEDLTRMLIIITNDIDNNVILTMDGPDGQEKQFKFCFDLGADRLMLSKWLLFDAQLAGDHARFVTLCAKTKLTNALALRNLSSQFWYCISPVRL